MGRKRLAARYRVNRVKSKTKGWRYRVLCRDTGDHMGTWDSWEEADKAAYKMDMEAGNLRMFSDPAMARSKRWRAIESGPEIPVHEPR